MKTDSAVGGQSGGYGFNEPSLYGGGSFIPLLTTNQVTSRIIISGQSVTVFDHPFSENNEHIYKQGSAFPDDGSGNGITGTCGLCSVATIINKAGGHATEKSVAKYALQRGLCSNRADKPPGHRGGTNAQQQAQLLTDAGINSSAIAGISLEKLVEYVEQGHGVIIGVNASRYKPDWYAPGGGHAIVLESPVRDSATGRITGYIVSDSNGSSVLEASVVVDAHDLEEAFEDRYGIAVVTDDVIW